VNGTSATSASENQRPSCSSKTARGWHEIVCCSALTELCLSLAGHLRNDLPCGRAVGQAGCLRACSASWKCSFDLSARVGEAQADVARCLF
jgi:hypothetical protein